MNTRIYKNEFDPAYIAYLKDRYTVESETDKVLTLTGIDEADEEKFHAAMFKNYDQLVELFPDDFRRFSDAVADFAKSLHDLYYDRIIREQLRLQQSPAWSQTFANAENTAAWEKYNAISNCLHALEYLTR